MGPSSQGDIGARSAGFAARAATTNVDSERAKELANLDAEVVAADVDDMESLERPFAGAYGAYLVAFSSSNCFTRQTTAPRCLARLGAADNASKRTR
jgi:uncharacterized protein YbjT (DUF2867 family)